MSAQIEKPLAMEYYLSIITINFNNCSGLEKTAQSILPLPEACEWIIIDGDSDDGSSYFLESLPQTTHIQYLSEPDQGIYDAMNKGILRSRGKYLNFMNSGDTFIRSSLMQLLKSQKDDADIFMYDCKTITTDNKDGYSRKFPETIEEIKNWACVQHQSTLINRAVFDRLGLYSLEYKYLSDYEHSIKAYLHPNIHFQLNKHIKLALFSLDGVSTQPKTALKIAQEYKKIQLKYFGRYNYVLFISNYIKYIMYFIPFNSFIIKQLKKLFFSKR